MLRTVWLAGTVAAASCGAAATEPPGPVVVATTSIVGEVVAHVAGDGVRVEVLIGAGIDPHDFQATSQQLGLLQRADLVVAIGLGLEAGLADVIDAVSAAGGNVVEVGLALRGLRPAGDGFDPHVWMDPVLFADAALAIGAEMETVDPGGGYNARAEGYAAELGAADAEIAELLAPIPAAARRLVTNHDSMGYFAARYGFDVIGAVIPSATSGAAPSSAEIASLVAAMEAAGVEAIFAETTEPAGLAAAVAAEVGHDVEVVELYTGSLGEPGSGADTYIGMLLTNARRIAAALGS